MRIISIKHIPGPNLYHTEAVVIMTLDLEALTDVSSLDIPDFNERLIAFLPGLKNHHCSLGHPGGFIERLQRGTYFAHIVEHVTLELSTPAGVPVNYGKSIYAGPSGIYRVILRSKNHEVMSLLCHTAVELCTAIIQNKPYNLDAPLDRARRLVSRWELGPSAKAIVEAAEKRGIPWFRMSPSGHIIQLGMGCRRRFIESALTDQTGSIAVSIAQDKELTKNLLARALIPVPYGHTVNTLQEAVRAFASFSAPAAVKPLDSNHGNGITLNVNSVEELQQAFAHASTYSKSVLVEEFFRGRDYRALVVNHRLAAVSERIPAHVTGDGVHTIARLVELENQNPQRGEGHDKPLTLLRLDDTARVNLARQGLSEDSIPKNGERIFLSQVANLSIGGTAHDVTDQVHPGIKLLCERAARLIGLDICGIDLILDDISREPRAGANGIIEINAEPGLRMHLHPSQGKPQAVGQAIVDMIYPPGHESRIPIVAVTGTNGKTTVARLTAHILAQSGLHVGLTTTDGIFINGERIAKGDTTGPASAQAVLTDPSVEAAVLETARGGIIRRGLGYDWSDVGILTNIQPDHFGQDGIEDLKDILHIKSLVAERVREGGTLILNADDEELAKLSYSHRIAAVPRTIVFFSLHADHLRIRRHLENGGTAYVLDDGWITEFGPSGRFPVIQAADVPATLGGMADFQIANVLAATAACRALGCSPIDISSSLQSFTCDQTNPGRVNLYRVGRGFALVDYGHNPNAFQAISSMMRKWRGHKCSAVVSVPGDRSDELIRQSGHVLAKGFDKLIIREDADRRGRGAGETAGLLCRAVHEINPQMDCEIIIDEREAFSKAVSEMDYGEVIAFFYDDIPSIIAALRDAGATPAASLADPERQNLAVIKAAM